MWVPTRWKQFRNQPLVVYVWSETPLEEWKRTKLFDKYSLHIVAMSFGIEKYKVLTVQRGRRRRSDGIELPDDEHMKEIDFSG